MHTIVIFKNKKKHCELIDNCVQLLVEILGIKVIGLLLMWNYLLGSYSIITAFTGSLEQLINV